MSGSVDEAMQVVSLAIEVERRCSRLYHGWAQRFSAYDTGTSELLGVLAEEERAHEQTFRELKDQISAGGVPEDVALPAEFSACTDGLQKIQDQFFVTSPVMAATILEAALEIEYWTRRLYKDLESKTASAAVAVVCRRLSEYEGEHARILVERLEYEKQKLSLN